MALLGSLGVMVGDLPNDLTPFGFDRRNSDVVWFKNFREMLPECVTHLCH